MYGNDLRTLGNLSTTVAPKIFDDTSKSERYEEMAVFNFSFSII